MKGKKSYRAAEQMQGSEREGGGGWGSRAEIDSPVACDEDMERQIVSLKLMEDYTRADIQLQSMEVPHAGARGCALKEPEVFGEPTLEQSMPDL